MTRVRAWMVQSIWRSHCLNILLSDLKEDALTVENTVSSCLLLY